MFLDSQIAKPFTLAKDKTGYMVKFGIAAAYYKRQLVESINHACLCLIRALINRQKKKMHMHILFWRMVVSSLGILAQNSRDTEELMICCSTSK